MQTTAKSRESDEIVDLEHPFFWISIPRKKFFKNGEVAKPSVHFGEK